MPRVFTGKPPPKPPSVASSDAGSSDAGVFVPTYGSVAGSSVAGSRVSRRDGAVDDIDNPMSEARSQASERRRVD